MQVFPAIDIRDKKVVRLTQGDYDRMTVYADNPLDIAKGFEAVGATNMHVVDLDGALDGELVNFDTVKQLASQTGLFVEVGGGIRSSERIEKYLKAGAGRVILGTVAVEDYAFVEQAVKQYGDKIAVGVDAKDGYVAIHGWKTVTDIDSYEFCERLRDSGVKTVIYTDIAKDGALGGTNLAAYERLSKIEGLNIVASGGVTYLNEIDALKRMGIYGVILGKAMYTGKLDLADAIKTASEN